jgi:uncharacterized membrane protein
MKNELIEQRCKQVSVFFSHSKHNKDLNLYFFASLKMIGSMKTEKSAALASKLKNLFVLINQRALQFCKAVRSQPYLVSLFVAIFIYGIVFSYFTVQRHNVFQTSGWDLGVFDQALYTTLHNGKFLYYTADLFLIPSGCYFAQHVSPILFLVLPFYAINSSPITLLIIKSFVLAFGALPLYLLARQLLKSEKASFMIGIVYLLYVPLQGANWFDFQPQVFLPVLFFSMFYFAVKSNWKLYFVAMVLAATVEEHVSMLIFLVAVYLLVTSKVRPFWKSLKSFRNMNQNLTAVITMIFSALYYVFTVGVRNSFTINPQFMYIYKALSAFSVLGVKADPLFFPVYALFNPQRAFAALLYDFPLKFLYLIFLFGPLLFFSLKSKLILVTFPFLGLFLLSNYDAYYSIGAHYPLYILALIFIAALIVLRRLQHDARISILKTMLIASMILTISVSPISPLSAPFANERLVWYTYTSVAANEKTASLNDLVSVIPSNASVLTQNTIFPHVSSRINAYVLPISSVMNDTEYLRSLIKNSEYILLDLSYQDFNTNFVLNEACYNNSYGAYALASSAILFKRGFESEPMFVHYTDYRVFSAYKDLELASFSQAISDSSAVSEKVVLCPENSVGYFVYGPYNYMLPGSYEVTFTVKVGEHNSSRVGKCDISDSQSGSIISKRDIFGFEVQSNTWNNFTLSFTSTKILADVEFRALSYGIADIYIDRVIMKRISPNATSDFGLWTFDSSDLSLDSGYVSEDGFLIFQQNTVSSGFWHGPYISLPPGKYRASVWLKVSPPPQDPLEHMLTLSVSANIGRDTLAKYEVKASDFLNEGETLDWQKFTLEFIATDNLSNVEFTGMAPSSNFNIYLAYVIVEKLVLSPDLNYELFSVQRGLEVKAGQIVNDASSHSGEVALSRKGLDEGVLTYGPYITLPNGTYNAIFRIKTFETSQNASVRFEVISQPDARLLSQMMLNSSEIHDGSWVNVTLPFSLDALTANIEFRVSSNGMTNLYVDIVTVLFP